MAVAWLTSVSAAAPPTAEVARTRARCGGACLSADSTAVVAEGLVVAAGIGGIGGIGIGGIVGARAARQAAQTARALLAIGSWRNAGSLKARRWQQFRPAPKRARLA